MIPHKAMAMRACDQQARKCCSFLSLFAPSKIKTDAISQFFMKRGGRGGIREQDNTGSKDGSTLKDRHAMVRSSSFVTKMRPPGMYISKDRFMHTDMNKVMRIAGACLALVH